MNIKARLDGIQAQLVKRGVKDVKFFFEPQRTYNREDVFEGAAVALEAYLNGRCTPVQLGDSCRV